MKVKKWLTINSSGSARLSCGKPNIGWDEVSVLLDVNLPDALFQRPRLEAKINIPEEAAAREVITSDVVENVKEAIETATGLTFSINVVKEEIEES